MFNKQLPEERVASKYDNWSLIILLLITGVVVGFLVFYYTIDKVCAWDTKKESTYCQTAISPTPIGSLSVSPTTSSDTPPQEVSPELSVTPTAGESATPTSIPGPTNTPTPGLGPTSTPGPSQVTTVNNVPQSAPDTGRAK